jgi:endonuclease YncB( thermonuclease family)
VQPRSNSLSTRNAKAICSHRATTLIPHRTPFLLLAAVLIPTIVCAADFSGSVVSVLDGDTIEVLHKHHPERICLSGIDCPEKGQAYGTRAKEAASVLVFGKYVILQTHTARTSTDGRLPMCSCPMAPTSITSSSKTAGAGQSVQRQTTCR